MVVKSRRSGLKERLIKHDIDVNPELANTQSDGAATHNAQPQPQKGRCSGVLKYILLVVIVPAFLNHAALYQETIGLKPPLGELYDIGMGQKLYMGCVGQGKPTVILDAPTGLSSDAWSLVVPQLAKITKVCVYDRAGLGFSDRPFVNKSIEHDKSKRRDVPSTTEKMVDDFHQLFTASSSQPKPFILVGAELGAVNARFFTQLFDDQVVGLVMINPLTEQMFNDERNSWTNAWLKSHISTLQTLQFSASIGISRLLFIFGLMKTPLDETLVSKAVTARQKHLMCKPGHLSSAVDEYFFANESLSQIKTLSKLKRFDPNAVGVSVLISDTYSKQSNNRINKEWMTAKSRIKTFFGAGIDTVHLSGSADSALLVNFKTIVSTIEKHVKTWRKNSNSQENSQKPLNM